MSSTSSPSLLPSEARLVALFVECIFYGIYLITLAYALQVIFWDHHNHSLKKPNNIPLAIVTILFAVVATLEVACNLEFCLLAFVRYKGQGGPDAVFTDISYWADVTLYACLHATELLTDAMLIYRCLIVYYYNFAVIILPALIWLANLGLSISVVFVTATLNSNALVYTKQLKPLVTAFLALSLCSNFLTTGLIAYRIAAVKREVSSVHYSSSTASPPGAKLGHAMRIIVESGLLNAISVLITFITVAISSNALYISADAGKMIHAISFNLIIIRVKRPFSRRKDSEDVTITEPTIPLQFRTRVTTAMSEVPATEDVVDLGTMMSMTGGRGANITMDSSVNEKAEDEHREAPVFLGVKKFSEKGKDDGESGTWNSSSIQDNTNSSSSMGEIHQPH